MCDGDDNNNDCDSLACGSAVSDQEYDHGGAQDDPAHATTAKHAEVYFNLLCSVEPSRLKLTVSQELDDRQGWCGILIFDKYTYLASF